MDISKNKMVQYIIDTNEMVPYFTLYFIALLPYVLCHEKLMFRILDNQ